MASPINDGLQLPINSNRPDRSNERREPGALREAPGHSDNGPLQVGDRVSLSGLGRTLETDNGTGAEMSSERASAMAERIGRMMAVGPTFALNAHTARLPEDAAALLR